MMLKGDSFGCDLFMAPPTERDRAYGEKKMKQLERALKALFQALLFLAGIAIALGLMAVLYFIGGSVAVGLGVPVEEVEHYGYGFAAVVVVFSTLLASLWK